MAGSVNKVILIGNLGGDPDIKRTADGRPVASFSIATSDTWRDKATGERKEKTEWHRIAVFNEALCGIAEKYLKKGHKVYVEGVLRTRKWTDQAGVERYATQVNLENFNGVLTMLQSAGGNRPPDDVGAGEDMTRPGVAPRGGGTDRSISSGLGGGRGSDMDDDIPF